MNNDLTVDQRWRIKAVEMAFAVFAEHQEKVEFFDLLTDIYEFIKGEQK